LVNAVNITGGLGVRQVRVRGADAPSDAGAVAPVPFA